MVRIVLSLGLPKDKEKEWFCPGSVKSSSPWQQEKRSLLLDLNPQGQYF